MDESGTHSARITAGARAAITTRAARTPNAAIRADAPSDPIARANARSPSRTPNTRASTSSGAIRCRSVVPATHATLPPAPATANQTGAVAAAGAAPITATGPLNTNVPPASAGTSRRRPTSVTASAAPTSAPNPLAELRKPAQLCPLPSTEIATATNSTSSAPDRTIPPESTSTTTLARRSPRRNRNPPSDARPTSLAPDIACGGASPAEIWRWATSDAARTITTAKMAYTWDGPQRASRMPATNGPTTIPALPANIDRALAAVSSSGPFETLGKSAACVGLVIIRLHVAIDANTMTTTNGRVDRQCDRRQAERQRLHEVADEQHTVAPEPIAHEAHERRDDAAWHELDRRDRPRRRGPSPLVSVDEHRHPRGELGGRESEVRDADPEQAGVAHDGAHDPDLLLHGEQDCTRRKHALAPSTTRGPAVTRLRPCSRRTAGRCPSHRETRRNSGSPPMPGAPTCA